MTILLYVLGGLVAWALLAGVVVAFVAAGSPVSAEEMAHRAGAARRQRRVSAKAAPEQAPANAVETAGHPRPNWVAAHWERATSIAEQLDAQLTMSGAGTIAVDDGPQERFLVVDITRGTRMTSVGCRTAHGQGLITDLRAASALDGATLATALGSNGVLEAAHWNVLLASLRAWVTEVDRIAPSADRWTAVHRDAVRNLAA